MTPDRCITCSDEAVEAVVVAVHGSEAVVRLCGGEESAAAGLPARFAATTGGRGQEEHVANNVTAAAAGPARQEEHVAIDLVPDAAVGDVLLCHAGIALERLERSHEPAQVAQSHKVPTAPKPATHAAKPESAIPQVAQSHKVSTAPEPGLHAANPRTENPQVAQSHKVLAASGERQTAA